MHSFVFSFFALFCVFFIRCHLLCLLHRCETHMVHIHLPRNALRATVNHARGTYLLSRGA
jgi:hypothetical protein